METKINPNDERRRHDRFSTDVKIQFYVPYDLNTKVKFKVADQKNMKQELPQHTGYTKNISAGGICFTSEWELGKGDYLLLDVFVPQVADPVVMEGVVCWSRVSQSPQLPGLQYDTGVQILKVRDKSVEGSIYFDQAHQVIWSEVLESVLGSFSKLFKKVY